MNSFFPIGGAVWWQIAGWTMLHFLWLGTLMGLAAMVGRFLVRRASAETRYATALVSLVLLAALPLAIAAWLSARAPVETPVVSELPQAGGIVELHNGAAVPIGASASGSAGGFVPDDAAISIAAPSDVAPADPRQSRGLMDVFATMPATWVPFLPWLWLVGTPLTFVLIATGVVGAERLRRDSRMIDDGPIVAARARLRQSLGVSRQVAVAVCERIAAPVLVGILRPVILLPPAALTGWSPDEIEMVLLHELAHVRRWDNLVNLVQRLIESLLFFHPAVWLVSDWVRREREACCDAVVVHRTNRPHAYAEMLVALAAQMPRSVLFHPAATSAMAAGPLRARIRRILQLEDDPMLVSGKSFAFVLAGLLVAATLAVLYLPGVGQAEESTTEVTKSTELKHAVILGDSIESPKTLTADEFPFTVRFDAGASKFLDGDNITVLEIRGTAETLMPGNRYLIKGTYALESRDKAQLSAFTTAMEAADGTGPVQRIQTTIVDRGKGKFSLILPMSVRGWPHVSFYPADGGDGFGGLYFGTGDSLLTKWWGSDESTERAATNSPISTRASRFPSLEDQKLADLAWKQLNLELEPIGQEDLKRVRALDYDGGVKVTNTTNVDRWNILAGDILVGLHVWPTTSLKEVAGVLSRNDLGELNPLKFYVVRKPGGFGHPGDDTIVTGRITVNISRSRVRSHSADSSQSIEQQVEQQLAQDSQAALLQHELVGAQFRYAEVKKSTRGELRETALLGSQIADLQRRYAQYRESVKRQIEDQLSNTRELGSTDNRDNIDRPEVDTLELRTEVPTEAAQNEPSSTKPTPGPVTDWPRSQAPERSLLAEPNHTTDAALPRSSAASADGSDKPPAAGVNKANLRYDGKTFDEWRQMWRTELSTERRLEAVKALAAFGAAGYGKEAAEAILDVVKQYDWSVIGQSPVSQLKNEAIRAFTGNGEGAASIALDDWLPVLVDGVKSGNKRVIAFANLVIQDPVFSEVDVPRLIELSRDDSLKAVRFAILSRLMAQQFRQPDSQIVGRMNEVFEKEPEFAAAALPVLYPAVLVSDERRMMGGFMGGGYMPGVGGNGLPTRATIPAAEYRPELLNLLEHGNPAVQSMVVSALADLGPKALPAMPRLLPLLLEIDQEAAVRLARIIPTIAGSDEATEFLNRTIKEDKSPKRRQRAAAILEVLQTLTPPTSATRYDGIQIPDGRGGSGPEGQ